MILSHISVRWLALPVSLLLVGAQIAADERPGKHTHDDTAPHGKPVEGHGHTMDGPHQHPWWETPPAEYANARSTRWDDAAAIARGQQLYQTYCLMCHGADGQGTGSPTVITFKPTQARFVRISQTATIENAPPFSIQQLRLYRASTAASTR